MCEVSMSSSPMIGSSPVPPPVPLPALQVNALESSLPPLFKEAEGDFYKIDLTTQKIIEARGSEIRSLDLSGIPMTADKMQAIVTRFPTLHKIELRACGLTCRVVQVLSGLQSLLQVDLRGNKGIDAKDLSACINKLRKKHGMVVLFS